MFNRTFNRDRLQKAPGSTFTLQTPAETTGLVINNSAPDLRGVFSWCAGEIISEVAQGGSPLSQWIPVQPVRTWRENVAHLSWIAGDEFRGDQSYFDRITSQPEPADCDWGPGGMDFQVCECQFEMGRVSISNKDKPLFLEHFQSPDQLRYCENEPQYIWRGPRSGEVINTDAEWILAMLTIELEDHLSWNAIHGTKAIASGIGMYDGLNEIIRPGYISEHRIGDGSCDFTDPLSYSGVEINDARMLLKRIEFIVRKIRKRMSDRRVEPTGDDMVVAMPYVFWTKVAREIALGSLTPGTQTYIQFNTTPEVYDRTLERTTTGGLGFGNIVIDGKPIPVICDDALGVNTNQGATPTHTGDVYILTKRFRNINILSHQFLTYDGYTIPPGANMMIMQNGMLRTSWVNLNERCYYYGMEMKARYVTKMQPLQAKIADVTLPLDMEGEFEASTWTHKNFYAYNGQNAWAGTQLIRGYSDTAP